MSKDQHIKFEHRECLSQETLQRYASGLLSPKERHLVEKHTMGCDLCADALEGVLAMKDPNRLQSIVRDLNQRIQERGSRKPIVLWMDTRVRVAVAAGVVLLVGFFVLFNNSLNKEDKTVSDNLVKEQFQSADEKKQNAAPVGGLTDSLKTANPSENENKLTQSVSKDPGTVMGPVAHNDRSASGEEQKSRSITDLENNSQDYRKDAKPDDKQVVMDEMSGKQYEQPNKSGGKTDEDTKYLNKDKSKEEQDKNGEVNVTVLSKTQQDDQTISPVTQREEEKVTSRGNVTKKNKKQEGDEIVKQEPKKDNYKGKTSDQKSPSYYDMPSNTPSPNVQTGSSAPKTEVTLNEKNVPTSSNGSGSVNTNNNGNTTTTTVSDPGKDLDLLDGNVYTANDSTKLSSVDVILVQAKKKYEAKEYDTALKLFNQVLGYDPKNREALYYAGASYLAKNDPDNAIASYDKVITLGKGLKYDEARYDKSVALMKKNKNEEARRILDDLIKEGGPMKPKAVDLEKK